MTDRKPFLARILAEPGDIGVRLVYADWLEENPEGEADIAFSEFIRRQCNHQGMADPRREQDLLVRWWKSWFPAFGRCAMHSQRDAPVLQHYGHAWTSCGFVEVVQCDWRRWIPMADIATAGSPIRRVELTTRPNLVFTELEIRTKRDEAERQTLFYYSVSAADPELRVLTERRWSSCTPVSDRELAVSRGNSPSLSLARQQANELRTPLGYLHNRWPSVREWDMPPAITDTFTDAGGTSLADAGDWPGDIDADAP